MQAYLQATCFAGNRRDQETSLRQKKIGWLMGLEPTTLGTTIRCSNQLSYSHRDKDAAIG